MSEFNILHCSVVLHSTVNCMLLALNFIRVCVSAYEAFSTQFDYKLQDNYVQLQTEDVYVLYLCNDRCTEQNNAAAHLL